MVCKYTQYWGGSLSLWCASIHNTREDHCHYGVQVYTILGRITEDPSAKLREETPFRGNSLNAGIYNRQRYFLMYQE